MRPFETEAPREPGSPFLPAREKIEASADAKRRPCRPLDRLGLGCDHFLLRRSHRNKGEPGAAVGDELRRSPPRGGVLAKSHRRAMLHEFDLLIFFPEVAQQCC